MANVVIVEDEAELRRIVAEELSDAGHEVRQASNGAEGIGLILGCRPDLVISDCLMPVMTGAQMLERLRTLHPECRTLPFLFLSAHADKQYIEGVLAHGADAYLTKPVDLDRLLETVDLLLGKASGESDTPAAAPSGASEER